MCIIFNVCNSNSIRNGQKQIQLLCFADFITRFLVSDIYLYKNGDPMLCYLPAPPAQEQQRRSGLATEVIASSCCISTSVADTGCFILDPGSESEHFSVPDPGCFILDPGSESERFSIPDPGSYIKRVMKNKNYLLYCSLWFQEQVLIVKKIICLGSGSRIQNPGGIKEPDLGYRIRNKPMFSGRYLCGFCSAPTLLTKPPSASRLKKRLPLFRCQDGKNNRKTGMSIFR
jgi:hypothetical protein